MFVTFTLNPAIDHTMTVQPALSVGTLGTVVGDCRTPGGKGVNVAKMIAVNRQPVIAGGVLGRGELAFYQRSLKPAGLICRFLTVPYPTRENILLTDGHGHELKLNRPGFPDLDYKEALLFRYADTVVRRTAVVILSGSLPARFPPDTYARLIRHFRATGCSTVLDTSGPALAAGLAEKPAVIKPNRQELEDVLQRRLTFDRALIRVLKDMMTRHEVVVLSDGAVGAWFASRGLILFAASPPVSPVDTTGAGDALLGQFCADYFPARQLTPALAARAVAAGTAAVEQRGTPLLRMRRVRALAATVTVTRRD